MPPRPAKLLLLSLLLPPAVLANLLTNGDFESAAEDGWEYQGTNDGSSGIFSEPSRPGTHVYMLQLAGTGERGRSGIRQAAALSPGKTYRLTLEFHETCDRPEAARAGRLIATIDGAYAFTHDLTLGVPETGWAERRATFRAERAETEIAIELNGAKLEREESTVLIDNVRLEEIDLELPGPLLRGKPLSPVLKRQFVPSSIAYGRNGISLAGYEPLEDFRELSGRSPALCEWRGGWDSRFNEAEAFHETRRSIHAWARLGTVPIVSPETMEAEFDAILRGDRDAYFRAWARNAMEWGYPLILRPWPEMDQSSREYGQSAGPNRFIDLWRRLHRLFQEEGAHNVLWFWSPSDLSDETEHFYPGDDVVDFVGCSWYAKDGLASLDRSYLYFLKRHREKAFAISESASVSGDQGKWIRDLYTHALTRYQRMEFYTHSNFNNTGISGRDDRIEQNPEGIAAYREIRDHGILQNRLAQDTPPLLKGLVTRKSDSVALELTNLGGPYAFPSSRLKVEFWAGDPAVEGSQLVGKEKWVTLNQSETESLSQSWKHAGPGKVFVKVDRSADPRFYPSAPDVKDVMLFTLPEPAEQP